MPLYEYECDACGHRFEKIQKFSDPLESTCPKCGGAVHKLMSSPAIQFKGSGFYITDYAKKEHVASAKADRAESSKSDGNAKSDKSEKSDKSDSAASTKSDAPSSSPSSSDSSSSTTSSTTTTTPAAKSST
jgi:putative FmdB family regulatory protein